METTYTVRQAAAALGVAKSTVLRNLEELPQEMTAIGSYRGQPMKLVTAAGIQRLAMLLSVAKINYEALNEASRSAPSADLSEASEAKQNEAHQEELMAELRDRIRAQEDQITMLGDALAREQEAHARTQDALAAAQALHAATAEQLRLLTAGAHPENQVGQEDQEAAGAGDQTAAGPGFERGPAAEGVDGRNQDAPPAAPSAAPEPEIPRKLSFRERLRILFTGE